MSKKAKILEKRRKEVLRAFAKGEGITSIKERICNKYDITPNAFWYDWAKIRPDRQAEAKTATFGERFEAAAHKEQGA